MNVSALQQRIQKRVRNMETEANMRITPEQYAAANTEHAHQVAVFIWANDNKAMYPELASLFAIPNGGERVKAIAARLKAEGVKSGVSDIFLPVARMNRERVGGHAVYYHGLFIEMKVPGRHATDEQKAFIELMKLRGYAATVCRGWIEARDVLLSYLKLGS